MTGNILSWVDSTLAPLNALKLTVALIINGFDGVADLNMMAGPGSGGTSGSPVTPPDRVWSLKELDILQDMTKPIAVVVSGAYEDPHW